jgi:hypothetical protein
VWNGSKVAGSKINTVLCPLRHDIRDTHQHRHSRQAAHTRAWSYGDADSRATIKYFLCSADVHRGPEAVGMLRIANNICTSFLGWTSYVAFEFLVWGIVVAFIGTLVLQLM